MAEIKLASQQTISAVKQKITDHKKEIEDKNTAIQDVKSDFENIQGGLYTQVITPYASRRNSIMHDVKKLLGISYQV